MSSFLFLDVLLPASHASKSPEPHQRPHPSPFLASSRYHHWAQRSTSPLYIPTTQHNPEKHQEKIRKQDTCIHSRRCLLTQHYIPANGDLPLRRKRLGSKICVVREELEIIIELIRISKVAEPSVSRGGHDACGALIEPMKHIFMWFRTRGGGQWRPAF